jgi:hypothetical protein
MTSKVDAFVEAGLVESCCVDMVFGFDGMSAKKSVGEFWRIRSDNSFMK